MGGPIVTGPSPASTRDVADQIVVSVGPYMFQSSPRCESSSASFRGKASPPQSILNPGKPSQPASSSKRQVAGVACITVAFDSFSKLLKKGGAGGGLRLSGKILWP